MTTSTPPLRGTDHPYYAAEGSYFSVGWHTEFGSWAEFIEEQGSNDLDLNLLYRWDWRIPDPDDYGSWSGSGRTGLPSETAWTRPRRTFRPARRSR